jgi:hypothetical protein
MTNVTGKVTNELLFSPLVNYLHQRRMYTAVHYHCIRPCNW